MATRGDFLPICEPAVGWVFGCCRRGASHVHSNTPCQDAYGISTGSMAGSPYVAIAVADGHGDKKHDLSQFGAALAVQAALEEMRSQFLHFGCEAVPLVKHFKADFPRRVVERWRKAVLNDARDRLEEEAPSSETNPNVWERYGTTLLVALATSEVILAGRIGDGDVLVVKPEGELESPFREDPSLFGSMTHSLSSPDAVLLWQTTLFQEVSGSLLFVATDGLGNAFQNEKDDDTQLHGFVKSLKDRITEYGMEKVSTAIPMWLDDLSENGSGDDITLALLFMRPQPAESGGKGPGSTEANDQPGLAQETTNEFAKRCADQGGNDGHQPDRQE